MQIAIGICIGLILSMIIDIWFEVKNKEPKTNSHMGDYSWIIKENKTLKEEIERLRDGLNDN